jgi:hypothetical protein
VILSSFGLGKVSQVERLTVTWPQTGKKQNLGCSAD